MCEYICLYIGINVKALFPPTPYLNTLCDDLSGVDRKGWVPVPHPGYHY